MADYGHEWADKRLTAMEDKIRTIYGETYLEARERLESILKTFESDDKKYADMVKAGTMKQRAYIAWRQETIGKAKHLADMIEVLTEDFANADIMAMKLVSGEAVDVYAVNANYAAFAIEKNMNVNLSWTLYDRGTVERLIRDDPDILPLPSVSIPLDMRWNRQHINAAITKGILLGDPIPEIAQRLVTVANMGMNAAIRNARTATTAAECAGRQDTYQRAKNMGIQLKKQWLATLDGKTRHAHRMLDGQTVDVEESFQVDGYKLKCPGDPSAPGYLIYNCRCTMISVDKFHDQNAPRAAKMCAVSYEEWKAGKEIEAANKWQTITDYSQNSVDNRIENGIIKINKSLGAKAKNYDVKLPNKEIVHLTEGTSITHVSVIAGKGRNRKIDMVDVLLDKYPGTQETEWVKAKGVGYIDYDGESYKTELHWYEEPSVGRVEWKVKPDGDGNWFIEDD